MAVVWKLGFDWNFLNKNNYAMSLIMNFYGLSVVKFINIDTNIMEKWHGLLIQKLYEI